MFNVVKICSQCFEQFLLFRMVVSFTDVLKFSLEGSHFNCAFFLKCKTVLFIARDPNANLCLNDKVSTISPIIEIL